MIAKRIINWLKRLSVCIMEDGHIFHSFDGKDLILVKEFARRWLSGDEKQGGTYTYDGKNEQFGCYLREMGFKNVRVIDGSVLRVSCETSAANMIRTRKMYDSDSEKEG